MALRIERIMDACKAADVPEPEFETGGLWVVFHYPEEAKERMSEKASEKASEKIIKEISRNSNATIASLAQLTGVTTRSVERNLKKLQESGQLKRIGSDKGGHWEVLK
ncbi:MAG: winged helix-turn-helix transcriptional regulator [Candidatus Marinimicrobia bacterium]|nr:winged helix-turn-helix transcriptional regulator [Candidatus Neomarinimicrobiota bacterium]